MSKRSKKAQAKTNVTPVAEVAAPVVVEGESKHSEHWQSLTRSIVPVRYKRKYRPLGDTCGDALVIALGLTLNPDKSKPIDLVAFNEVCADNGIDPVRWAHLNPGQMRMNLGNVLRGMIKRGEKVRISGAEIN